MQSPNNPNKSFNDSPARHVSQVLDKARETPVALRRASQAAKYEIPPKVPPVHGDPSSSISPKSIKDEKDYMNALNLMRSMHEPLRSLFLSFSLNQSTTPGFDVSSLKETGMDSTRWAKFCRDSNLQDGIMHLQPQDIDLIFMRAKNYNCPNPKVVRKLNFGAFRRALFLLAEYVKLPFDQFINLILYSASSGPSINATGLEYIRFYDDFRTYAGVHRQGGPTTTDAEKQPLASIVNRAIDNNGKGSVKLRTSCVDVDLDECGFNASQNCIKLGHNDDNCRENVDFEVVNSDQNYANRPPFSVFWRESDSSSVHLSRQAFIEERISHFQEIHAAQQKEYLFLDSKISEEMMKLEHDLKSKGVSSKFYPNLTVEEIESMYDDALQRRIDLKERFRHEHEVRSLDLLR